MARPKKNVVAEEIVEKSVGPIASAVDQDEMKENSVMEALQNRKKQRAPGNWVKVTPAALKMYQDGGQLFGYDPRTGEALLKEKK